MDPTHDVTIVGCGPVGATLAILLRSRGFSVLVLERHPDIYHLPRAVMMDDEIRRMMQNHDMEQHLDPLLEPMRGAEFVDKDFNHLMGVTTEAGRVGPLGHPPSCAHYQPELDALLRTVARERGAEIRLGATVADIGQDDTSATVTLDDGETITSRWLVGCDGANSTVRRLLGIDIEDLAFDQDWLVVDVDLTHPDEVDLPVIAQQVCDPARPQTFVPGVRRHRRWEFQIQEGETHEEMTDHDKVWELIEPWMSRAHGTLVRAVVYRFHAMVAETMRRGRIFLAGDAAHQMPPFLGQGLNTGMRDAINLTWKLDFVARGLADDRLLDTYSSERLPHAREIVAHAADVGRLIDSLAGRADHDVDERSAYGGGRKASAYADGAVVGDDALVGRQLHQPVVDGVFFDEQLTRGLDVVAADPSITMPAALAVQGGAVVPAAAAEQIAGHAAVIVRPDRYIAAVADSQDALDAAASALLSRMSAEGVE